VKRPVATGLVVLTALWPGVAAAQTGESPGGISPCDVAPADWCLDREEPGQGSAPPTSAPDSPGPDGEPPCGWVNVPAEIVPPPSSSRPYVLTNGRPPEGFEVVWQGWCYDAAPDAPQDFRGPFRWFPDTERAPTLTLEDIAADAYERLEGRMPEPTVVTSPPAGVDAVVDVPVFVQVTNWQPELVETGDLLGDAVTVRATPVVVFESGEPGAEPVVCNGPGRAYDPAAGDLWDQAVAPGACTYTYRQRTGAEDRPAQWSSVVTVRWSIEWWSESGDGGEFPEVPRPLAIARGVDEVRSVVVSGGT